jgi:hypothetical protein
LTFVSKMRITIRTKPKAKASDPSTITVDPTRLVVRTRPMRVLDFDIENRPLSYLGSDFTTAEVTAIAWAWTDQPEAVTVYLLGEHDLSYILKSFVDAFAQADMVTGHYITGHDLPMVNGALMECRMPPLPDIFVQDTKTHLIRSKGLSLSQESLGAMFRLDHQKVQMNQSKWRAANRLTRAGLAEVRQRVTGDVRQHIALRKELLASGYLTAPKQWKGGAAQVEAYIP